MTRGRPLDALIAALATVAVLLPLTTLFAPTTFLSPSLTVVLVVAVVGVLARWALAERWPVALLQLLAAFVVSVALHGRGHLWHGLPTPEMFDVWRRLLLDAFSTIQNYAAPAPSTRGVIVGITLIVGLIAVVVDFLAVTLRSPALAGLPLLTAYLIAAANSGVGLNVVFFLIAAIAWITLVGRQGATLFRGWGTPIPLDSPEVRLTDEALSMRFTTAGRRLAIGCLALAVVLPMVMPHLPARFLLSGLGRAPDGVGSGGSVQLSSSLDISRSLADQSQGAVFTYRSNAAASDPLRVDVLLGYRDGRWTQPDDDVAGRRLQDPPEGMTDDVTRSVVRLSVAHNKINPPQLAAPYPTVRADLGDVRWNATASDGLRPAKRASSYSVDYLKLSPSEAQLKDASAVGPGNAPAGFMALDPGSMETVARLNAKVIPDDADRIEAARAIQNYLRGPDFTYSLSLLPPTAKDEGDALNTFLRTRQGYCIQFATAMIMMARERGIPARMAIGFLPGHLQPDGSYTVRAADAHAWPELFFDGLGWLRFDPTPSSRSGTAPGYSSAPVPSPSDGASASTSQGPSASATSAPRTVDNQQDNPGALATPQSTPLRLWHAVIGLPSWAWLVVVLLLGLLGSLVLPAAAALRRRRGLAAAVDDAARAEAHWQDLLRQVGDLGVQPPTGSTPRQAGRFVAISAHLAPDDVAELRSVVDTIEKARYAVPGTAVGDLAEPTRHVIHAVGRTRPRWERLRARLVPSDGRAQVRGAVRALTGPPRAALQRLRALTHRDRDGA